MAAALIAMTNETRKCLLLIWDHRLNTLSQLAMLVFIFVGIGFIVGDGRLNYAPEWVTELYYDARLAPGLNAALNYQLVVNPAYNADRGPVNVFALRLRTAF